MIFDWTDMVNQESSKCKDVNIEDQVIKNQVKEIKLKNHVPRQMRVRVRFCKVY